MLVKQIRLPSYYDAAFRKQLTESAKAVERIMDCYPNRGINQREVKEIYNVRATEFQDQESS